MQMTSLLFGPRPNVFFWSACFFLLLTAGIAGYASTVATTWLPATPQGYVPLGGELLVRALLLGELARVLLVIYRDQDVSRLTRLLTICALIAVSATFLTLRVTTLAITPSPYPALTAILIMLWWIAHRFIDSMLFALDDLVQYKRRLAAIGGGPRDWMLQIQDAIDPRKVANFQRAQQRAIEQGIKFDPTDPENLRDQPEDNI